MQFFNRVILIEPFRCQGIACHDTGERKFRQLRGKERQAARNEMIHNMPGKYYGVLFRQADKEVLKAGNFTAVKNLQVLQKCRSEVWCCSEFNNITIINSLYKIRSR